MRKDVWRAAFSGATQDSWEWELISVFVHATTCLCLIISSQGIAEVLPQIKCSEETVESKSALSSGADGSEPVAITKPFSAQPIFNNSLYSNLQELCRCFCLQEGWAQTAVEWYPQAPVAQFKPTSDLISDG